MKNTNILKKRKIIAGAILLLVSSFCYGNDKFQILKKPEIKIKSTIYGPVMPSLKNPTPSFANVVNVDFSGIFLDTGFALSEISSDSVINLMARPLSLDFLEIGVGGGYHFYDYFDVFTEHDIISNSYVAYLFRDILRVQLNLGTFYKITDFKNQSVSENLFKSTMLIGLHVFWKINNMFETYFAFNTIDYFDYELLGSPFFKLGVNMNFSEKLTMGLDYTVKMIDMFAVAAHPSEMLLGIFVRVNL